MYNMKIQIGLRVVGFFIIWALIAWLSGCVPSTPTARITPQPIIEEEYKLYFPIIMDTIDTNIGVVTEQGWLTTQRWFNPETNLKVTCSWAQIEATQGRYAWGQCDRYMGDPLFLVFKNTPTWARPENGLICELPEERYFPNAVRAINHLLDRYPSVKYLELWNEPDTPPDHMPVEHQSFYGCIGDGIKYGEFYNYVASRVDRAVVVAGSLASPLNQFTVDMLNIAREEAVSFHCYPWYLNGTLFGEECIDRYYYLSTLTDTPVFLSETAVMYKSGSIEGYEQAQVAYYKMLRELPTYFFWYTVTANGWPVCSPIPCNTDMITRVDGIVYPRPVWFEYSDELRLINPYP